MDNDNYNIVRFFENPEKERRIVQQGLSLKEAREWCDDPETSSYTASYPKGCGGNEEKIRQWHEKKKHWFDGFEKV